MILQALKERHEFHGWPGIIAYILYVLINKLFYFDYLCLMTLEAGQTDPVFFGDLHGYYESFLSADEIASFAKDPKHQLNDDYVPLALQHGDACYGVCHEKVLANYSWYSKQPSKVTSDFKIHFPDNYVYTHHGYTHPDFRGKRLHAFGMAHALKHYTDESHQGLIAIVGGENVASLKSTKRLGYQIVGRIYLFACLGRYFVFHGRQALQGRAWLSPLSPKLRCYRFGLDDKSRNA